MERAIAVGIIIFSVINAGRMGTQCVCVCVCVLPVHRLVERLNEQTSGLYTNLSKFSTYKFL